MPSPPGVLRIGEVSRRTGVAVATLRAWEQRYGLLEPDRTEGGHRLYGDADIDRVRTMLRFLDEGWSAAAAARQVRQSRAAGAVSTPPDDGRPAAEQLVDRIHAAMIAFDAPRTDSLIDDVFARFEVPRALDDVLLPVMRRIGEGWEDDPQLIAREHFATNALRPRLQRLLQAGPRPPGRTCLAAAPEHEEHDLGLLSGSVVAAQAGWRVHYLGPRTPTRALERSIVELRPDVVLIGSLFRDHAERFLSDRPDFGGTPVVLGGSGFVPADSSRLVNAVVHAGPMAELASTLERALDRPEH